MVILFGEKSLYIIIWLYKLKNIIMANIIYFKGIFGSLILIYCFWLVFIVYLSIHAFHQNLLLHVIDEVR